MDGGERVCILRDMLLDELYNERLCYFSRCVISMISIVTISNFGDDYLIINAIFSIKLKVNAAYTL